VSDPPKAGGERLVCLRNPWGSDEWTGKWSDQNKKGEWDDDVMREACDFKDEDDGTFWMDINDFVKRTSGVTISRTFDFSWKKMTHYDKFTEGPIKATVTEAYEPEDDGEATLEEGQSVDVVDFNSAWYSMPNPDDKDDTLMFPSDKVEIDSRPIRQYSLSTSSGSMVRAVVVVMLPQIHMQRKFTFDEVDEINTKDTSYGTQALYILDEDDTIVYHKQEGCERCNWAEILLKPDVKYRVFVWATDGKSEGFCLRVYIKGGTAVLQQEEDGDLKDMEAFVLEANGDADDGHCKIIVTALEDYTPDEKDELAFAEGDQITITHQDDNGWWTGTNTAGEEGLFNSKEIKFSVVEPE
jgi:hypothetical protein